MVSLLDHPAGARILELLRYGEGSVGELQEVLGLDSRGTSQRLWAMRRRDLLERTRAGTGIFYCVRDPEVAPQILSAQLHETTAPLNDLAEPPATRRVRR